MSMNASGSCNNGPTTAVSTRNQRVTARIVRAPDGTLHHEYTADGRVYDSLAALQSDSPQSTHAERATGETHVFDHEGRHD
jgi:hypothetical protein